jgi:hypothetical protein
MLFLIFNLINLLIFIKFPKIKFISLILNNLFYFILELLFLFLIEI